MNKNSRSIIFDGNLIPVDKPVAPAESRGLMYGDGIFETFRTYSGQIFLLEKHLTRLKAGLNTLDIPAPTDLQIDKLKPLVSELLEKNDLSDAIIRVQAWRGGKRGYRPDSEARSHFSVTASPCPETFDPPKLVSVDRRRIPSEALPSDCKHSNGINYILAAREAEKKGGDDALMQTSDGWISETTIANIFWNKGDRVFTPSIDCDLLPGITRNIILDLIRQHDSLKLNEGTFELDHILDADSAWICNSVREILPVKQIDEHSLDVNHKAITELKRRFVRFRDDNLKPLN